MSTTQQNTPEAAAETNRLNSARGSVEVARAALESARRYVAQARENVADLELAVVDIWHFGQFEMRSESYQGILILRAMIEDFPRVESVLVNRLAEANAVLETMQTTMSPR